MPDWMSPLRIFSDALAGAIAGTILVRRIPLNLHELGRDSKQWCGKLEEATTAACAQIGDQTPDAVRFSRGSRMSRKASPSRLMPSTVMKMHSPGKSGSHHAVL